MSAPSHAALHRELQCFDELGAFGDIGTGPLFFLIQCQVEEHVEFAKGYSDVSVEQDLPFFQYCAVPVQSVQSRVIVFFLPSSMPFRDFGPEGLLHFDQGGPDLCEGVESAFENMRARSRRALEPSADPDASKRRNASKDEEREMLDHGQPQESNGLV